MARYAISQPEIKKAKNGREFFSANLINTVAFYADPVKFITFQEAFVAAWKPLLSVQHGGVAQLDSTEIPDNMKYISGAHAKYKPGFPFYKHYLTDIPANPTLGTPARKAGDIVTLRDGKTPAVFTELTVFTMFFMDPETGEKVYYKGADATSAGESLFRNVCSPVKVNETVDADPTNIAGDAALGTTMPI